MLYEVLGPAKSGKTEYMYGVLAEAFRNHESCIWIVPEQQSYQAEREILERLGNTSCLSVEVTTLKDLPRVVGRTFGGVAASYLDKGASCALLSYLIADNNRELLEYKDSELDEAFLGEVLNLFGKFRSEMVSPSALEEILKSDALKSDAGLKKKIHDISLLYAKYDAFFTEDCKDSKKTLSDLAMELPSKPYFLGKQVFIDGYYSFHEQEITLLKAIEKQAKNVYCSFPVDDRDFFQNSKNSADRLAKAIDQAKIIRLENVNGFSNGEFRFLEKNLWTSEKQSYAEKIQHIKIISAPTAFDESNAVAKEIMRLVRSGMRYQDIFVIARNAKSYSGILDAVLRGCGIPFFFSEKEDISSLPLVSFVCSSLEIIASDFSLSSVRKYLKSGFSGMDLDESDLLLRYADSWSLHGKRAYEEEWTRNPDGFTQRAMTEEQSSQLKAVNQARKAFLQSILPLYTELKKPYQNRTVDDILRALFQHLQRCESDKLFVKQINESLKKHSEDEARRYSQVWKLMMDVFDSIHSICGSSLMTVSKMSSLLKLTLDQYGIATIPPSTDAISIGDPVSLRPDHAKAAILMGCNDGVFPAAVNSSSLFDFEETEKLGNAEIHVGEAIDELLKLERFYFYMAATTASEQLILTYPTGTISGEKLRPSVAVNRLKALFSGLCVEEFSNTIQNLFITSKNVAAIFPLLPEGQEKEEVQSLLEQKGFCVDHDIPSLIDPYSKISLKDNRVFLSPSNLERYFYCPFSYFGLYVLKLREKKKNKFTNQNYGDFIHRMMELYLKEHTKTGKFIPSDATTVEQEVDGMAEQYFDQVLGGVQKENNQFMHMYRNQKKTILLAVQNLTEEFSQSDFVPVGFEVGFGRSSSRLPAVEYQTADGKKVEVNGSIDRVDEMMKDGNRYVRIVDYKTYGKSFSLDYTDYGLDNQMLIYLFSYCKLTATERGAAIPAGIIYRPIQMNLVGVHSNTPPEEISKEQLKKVSNVSGVILADNDVALSMDHNATGKFIPGHFKNGKLDIKNNTLTEEQFRQLEKRLDDQILQASSQIFDGQMDVRPLRLNSNYDACHYCKLKAVCRYQCSVNGEEEKDG